MDFPFPFANRAGICSMFVLEFPAFLSRPSPPRETSTIWQIFVLTAERSILDQKKVISGCFALRFQ